jgi:hypothetical protein
VPRFFVLFCFSLVGYLDGKQEGAAATAAVRATDLTETHAETGKFSIGALGIELLVSGFQIRSDFRLVLT